MAALPAMAWSGIRYALGISKKEDFKERLFAVVRYIPDMRSFLEDFWAVYERKLSDWYLRQKSGSDVIVSASSRFALEPICRKLGVNLIATEVDARTGRFYSPNCHGEEKVRRFRLVYPDAEIDFFYSDSLTDAPLARLAKKAFLVRKEKLSPWKG
jgi:phosphoserine phosphatase